VLLGVRIASAAAALTLAVCAPTALAAGPGAPLLPNPLDGLLAYSPAVGLPVATPFERLVAPGGSPRLRSPLRATPPLRDGTLVFPVYGVREFVDTFGAPRPDASFHHGDDIFAPVGTPLLAVADGTVFSVGRNDVGGNRLWLRDRRGNEFYYAHLSAFSAFAVDGLRVEAGDVLGYVGRTGDAEGTPSHLHFEVHPASLLRLGYDGAVDPTRYLLQARHLDGLRFPALVRRRPAATGLLLPLQAPARCTEVFDRLPQVVLHVLVRRDLRGSVRHPALRPDDLGIDLSRGRICGLHALLELFVVERALDVRLDVRGGVGHLLSGCGHPGPPLLTQVGLGMFYPLADG
jgi:hypothetical protein